MVTTFRISVGSGGVAVSLEMIKCRVPPRGRRLGWLAVLLITPLALVIACQALGLITGWYSLDHALNAPGPPWVYLLTAATAGVVAAGVVLLSRVRMTSAREGGRRELVVCLRLTTLEAAGFAVLTVLLGLFVAHLMADGLACARGIRSAC